MSQGELYAVRSAFIFMPCFLSPGRDAFPGKHVSQASNENSFFLLLSPDDSFLITFNVGSYEGLFKNLCDFFIQNTRIYTS